MRTLLFVYQILGVFLSIGLSLNLSWAGKYNEARPKIKNLNAQEHPELEQNDPEWKRLKESHVEAVAELLGMYPDYHIYFLARDGELLYDAAKELSQSTGNPQDEQRVHLINVSRLNKNDLNLKGYLETNGLSEKKLKGGRKVLFLDSGFSGSIPSHIIDQFPSQFRDQFKTQLLCSANANVPSMRVFLHAYNSNAGNTIASNFTSDICRYETRARATHRSTHYESESKVVSKKDGNQKTKTKWRAVVPDQSSDHDGTIDLDLAKKDMEDLKAYLVRKEVQDHYLKRKKFWSDFRGLVEAGNHNEIERELQNVLASNDPKKDSIARDAYEIIEKNIKEKVDSLHLFGRVGLRDAQFASTPYSNYSNTGSPYPGASDRSFDQAELIRMMASLIPDFGPFRYQLQPRQLGLINLPPGKIQMDYDGSRIIYNFFPDNPRDRLNAGWYKRQNPVMKEGVPRNIPKALPGAILLGFFENNQHFANDGKSWLTQTTTPEGMKIALYLLLSQIDPSKYPPLSSVLNLYSGVNSLPTSGPTSYPLGSFTKEIPGSETGSSRLRDGIVKAVYDGTKLSLYFKPNSRLNQRIYPWNDQPLAIPSLIPVAASSFTPDSSEDEHFLGFYEGDHFFEYDGKNLKHVNTVPGLTTLMVDQIQSKGTPVTGTSGNPSEKQKATADDRVPKLFKNQTEGDAEKVFTGPYANLCVVKFRLEQLLKEAKDPSEILLVLDVDDTLILRGKTIKNGEYHNIDEPGSNFVERPCALDLLKLAKDQGVHLNISSTHPEFAETLEKLSQIEAFTQLGMTTPNHCPAMQEAEFDLGTTKQKVSYYQSGKVISAKKQKSDTYFNSKAYAAVIGLSEEERKKIKTAILVDDSKTNHKIFEKELDDLAPHLPNLKKVGLVSLKKTKQSQFEKSYLKAAKDGPPVQSLYSESYSRVAPVMIGAVDQFLRDGMKEHGTDHPKFYFLARDGLGGYEIAKILIQKFPDRYKPLTVDQLHYVHLNKNTIHSQHAKDYLLQTGLKANEKAHFFDIGWSGSAIPALKQLVQNSGAQFAGAYMIFTHNHNNPDVKGYLSFQFGETNHPFGTVSGNKAVHFMEDTFSGIEKRSAQLLKGSDGKIIPESQGKYYDGDIRLRRETALGALRDAASDLDLNDLGELNSLKPQAGKSILYPFLDRINSNDQGIQKIMVPHEK